MNSSTLDLPIVGLVDMPSEPLVALLQQLAEQNIRCGVLQLADEDFDPDVPGKDSYELRHAGVTQLLLAAERKSALLQEYSHTHPELNHCLAQLAMDELDLLLVVDPPIDWLTADHRIHMPLPSALSSPAALADYIHTTLISPQSGDSAR